jgi:type IV secretory pathway VirB4 component
MNIFGTSGSGKSVTAKLIITRLVLRNVQSIILDPEGEYGKLCESLGGQNIKLGAGQGVDPFIIFSGIEISIRDQVQILKHFFSFYIQEQNLDSSLLDKVLMQILEYPEQANMYKFMEFLDLNALSSNPGLCNDIRQLAEGSLAFLFKMSQVVDFSPEIICFDLSGLKTTEQKVPFLFLMGSLINRMLDKAERRRMIFIDEAHKLLHNQETTEFYIDLVKTARKRKAGVVSITQNPEDFKESDNSRTIITQAETTILLKQAPASLNYISRFNLFRLTDRESSDLGAFAIGEALFIREREHIYLNVFPFPAEARLVFTS